MQERYLLHSARQRSNMSQHLDRAELFLLDLETRQLVHELLFSWETSSSKLFSAQTTAAPPFLLPPAPAQEVAWQQVSVCPTPSSLPLRGLGSQEVARLGFAGELLWVGDCPFPGLLVAVLLLLLLAAVVMT